MCLWENGDNLFKRRGKKKSLLVKEILKFSESTWKLLKRSTNKSNKYLIYLLRNPYFIFIQYLLLADITQYYFLYNILIHLFNM